VTTMETRNSMFRNSRGSRAARGMLTSVAVHALVLALLMLAAHTLLRSAPTKKERELDIVFYHPPAYRGPRARGPAFSSARDGCGGGPKGGRRHPR